MEEQPAQPQTPEFLGDVDEQCHLPDENDFVEKEHEETFTSSPNNNDNNNNNNSSSSSATTMETSTLEETADNNKSNKCVHQSFAALEELQKTLPHPKPNVAPTTQTSSSSPSTATADLNRLGRGTQSSNAKLQTTTNGTTTTTSKRIPTTPRTNMRPKIKTTPLHRVATSPSTPKPAGFLPRVATLQSKYPPSKHYQSVSRREQDEVECQKKFKAKPLPAHLYHSTHTRSSLSNRKSSIVPEYRKPTLSFLAKVVRQEEDTPDTKVTKTTCSPPPPPRTSTSTTRKKRVKTKPPKQSLATATTTTTTTKISAKSADDELDALLLDNDSKSPNDVRHDFEQDEKEPILPRQLSFESEELN